MSRHLAALMIGNAAYEGSTQPKNPGNDADDVAAKLEACGSDMAKVIDCSNAELDRALKRFKRAAWAKPWNRSSASRGPVSMPHWVACMRKLLTIAEAASRSSNIPDDPDHTGGVRSGSSFDPRSLPVAPGDRSIALRRLRDLSFRY